MLEAHHHDTYGEAEGDSDTTSSASDTLVGVDMPSTCTAPKGEDISHGDESERAVHEAIGVLKKHKDFLEKQQLLAESYHLKQLPPNLPATVSSRRCTGEKPSTSEGDTGQRKLSQAEKNRKRKMKKRKAKEKRIKLSGT